MFLELFIWGATPVKGNGKEREKECCQMACKQSGMPEQGSLQVTKKLPSLSCIEAV